MNINTKIDSRATRVMTALREKGYQAYLVGGSVRDLLMGMTPKDWDICTSATPQEVIGVFSGRREKVIETGIKHGTVTILTDELPVEVTTFRVEGKYSDSRRPDEVSFDATLTDDLSRRDFTMNATAYPEYESTTAIKNNLIDPYNGLEDIEHRVIRAVGDPCERIKEDPLRLLRALRFASIYSFSIDDRLSNAIKKQRNLLENIASERINSEFTRMLCGDDIEHILNEYRDVIAVFIPEIEPMFDFDQKNIYHHLDIWQHTVKSVSEAPKDKIIRLTMFFHDIGKPECYSYDKNTKTGHFYGHPKASADMARKIMRRLKYDNATRSDVSELVYYHDTKPQNNKIIRMLNRIGEYRYGKLLDVQKADIRAQASEFAEDKLIELDEIRNELEHILEEKKSFKISDLAVDGRDLLDAGVPQGVKIGQLLRKLLQEVMDGNIPNDRENLLHTVSQYVRGD